MKTDLMKSKLKLILKMVNLKKVRLVDLFNTIYFNKNGNIQKSDKKDKVSYRADV